MTAPVAYNVPNVPVDPMFELDGKPVYLTSVGKNFFEQFINYFFQNFSNEGLVAPTQTAANIATLAAFTNPNGTYKIQYGTILYDSTNNSVRMAINNGSGAPTFKTVTLT